ncbi:lipopolysaccharide-induced tumor necrosis factor-alpha factor homolog isoform X1 [Trichoplusia ni]|uniref:Lipopolysaccharide-induced tumor necrosis factor-alpha factor homolog isoform X1 n=2 Tax=Trichoplusia ni TaxID=7111 RepID=A0A7E5X042_TRINI|nr:lipopolysaccharide-induced tumor necrosis factor-alpha factor homolog isoform X1 [Trichoplusia ni]
METNKMNIVAVGPEPSQITCPSCRATIVTRVERKATTKTHVIAVLLCLFLCWPCVCVPYCVDSCQNADHYCPNCSSYLGTYQR